MSVRKDSGECSWTFIPQSSSSTLRSFEHEVTKDHLGRDGSVDTKQNDLWIGDFKERVGVDYWEEPVVVSTHRVS